MNRASSVDTILDAIKRSERSERQISLAACEHAGTISNLKRSRDARLSTVEALCGELGLELYVGPPRRELDVNAVATALQLPPNAPLDELLSAIARLRGSERARRALYDALGLIQRGVDRTARALDDLKAGR